MFDAPCDNKGVDACNHHEFLSLYDNFVASHDNTGTNSDALELVLLCDNLGRLTPGGFFFWPFLLRRVVALCNNLVTPCGNEV